jgi:raffinose/stachyose/melibiose transport system permease protein
VVQAQGLTTAAAPRSTGGRGAGNPPTAPRWPLVVAFVAPAFLLYTGFIVYPLASALQYSFFEWRGTARGAFTGFDNFTKLVTTYPLNHELWRAFLHNGVFFIGTMLIQNTAGLAFAIWLQKRRGKRFLQTAFTMPYLVSPLVVGYLWSLILSPTFGPLNAALRAVGLDSLALPWLGDPQTALPVVILVNAWQWVGFPMLLFAAALAGIPEEYGEAATVDGASGWQRFRHITLPLLAPAISIVSVLTFIGNFNVFGLVFAMGTSEGGPAGSTDVLELLFYRTAFESHGDLNAIGRSSALAVVMFVFIFGVSLAANRALRRREARLT